MSDQQLPNFKVHLNYPNNEEYDYFTKLERIDYSAAGGGADSECSV